MNHPTGQLDEELHPFGSIELRSLVGASKHFSGDRLSGRAPQPSQDSLPGNRSTRKHSAGANPRAAPIPK